jgi:hypothetical protein
MKLLQPLLAIIISYISFTTNTYAQADKLQSPPQNNGLPYTRSAKATAFAAINNTIAFFGGSKYAYVNGYKVRLDTTNILRCEAVFKNNQLFIPEGFASVIVKEHSAITPIPKDLQAIADRWVYDIQLQKINIPVSIPSIQMKQRRYIDAVALAKSLNKKIVFTKRGLLLISNNTISYNESNKIVDDAVVTLFDTPEKFADPDIATEYIPSLKRQGKWTDHVKVTPQQLAILNGEETDWQFTPSSQFNYNGFNQKLLGSKVPAPGIYPRILFSEEDVPMLYERIKSNKVGQKSLIEVEYLLKSTWWDESTSDGQVFKKLYEGKLKDLEWAVGQVPNAPPSNIAHVFKDEKPGIYNSHIAYVPECLSTMALYCLLTNDNVHGKQAATAIANYFKLREPLIDEWNAASDSEMSTSYTKPDGTVVEIGGNGAATAWRNIHGVVAHMNLGLALDFGGKWMTQEQKDIMRRVIAKATYGRRGYGQDGSIRFRDINWVSWDLPNYLAVTAIEGLEGFDKEAYQANVETVKAFCEWGIDDNGVVYESNGKTPGGFQFHTLSMIALARRGENLFGHPHIRKLLQAQVMMTSPSGKVVVNSGTQYTPFSQQYLSLQLINEYKAFFPDDKNADYLLSQPTAFGDRNDEALREWIFDGFAPEKYKKEVSSVKRLRMPSPMYPGFVHGLLYDTDFSLTKREALPLPLDFNAPTHGVFSSYSSHTKDAVWINMMVRPDHYLGGGHHHADAGMIHFSALGVDWFTESPFPQVYDGKYHNQVLVDGISEPGGISGLGTGYQAAATYLGTNINKNISVASADLTNSYTYRWQTQPAPIWEPQMQALSWELDTSAQNLKIFAGTARYKMRPWWATYTYSNYIATSRALFNPMQYVYRSVALIRGKHNYGLVIDDLKKDENTHLYQWTVMLNGGVWQADIQGLNSNQIVLAQREYDVKNYGKETFIQPKKDEPLLLVCYVNDDITSAVNMPLLQVTTALGPQDSHIAKTNFYDKLSINLQAIKANYKVLLIPFKYGEEIPSIQYQNNKLIVSWKDGQKDELLFTKKSNGKTEVFYQ